MIKNSYNKKNIIGKNMHFCPHCVSQTILYIVSGVTIIPFLALKIKNKISNYVVKKRCKHHHAFDKHVHK